ncbi:GNAT family N-acetyltransferase [Pararobbsia silviterrae]|uniref:GNAT family N-acetyltransferase n=1 Tax=Pararobbsia silviterrae TaxID=1792498 RepID=A0A494Y133_9BURK|nr:GNAT family N-acetyltransferase [Pararobbsia silviterrae]RKP56472.1 GNAT family N-acetyltransferase [Pararobbsia silviterrae]
MQSASIRFARADDARAIHGLIAELADFERLTDLLVATPESLRDALAGDTPRVECLVAERDGVVVAYALFFHNYSTFLGRRGLYLEDLYVSPAARRAGLATALLRKLAAIAVERRCARFEWTVLDWNTAAIAFYESLGATVLPDWRVVRMTGDALTAFAQP